MAFPLILKYAVGREKVSFDEKPGIPRLLDEWRKIVPNGWSDFRPLTPYSIDPPARETPGEDVDEDPPALSGPGESRG
jgi:hypothetical protein